MTKSWQPTQAWSFNGSWNDKKKIYERYHWKNQSNLNKDCTERTEFLSVILLWLAYEDREGNGTPLQYSCPENPRDGGAWQAAIYGVAQSRTRLKRLSSSSSSSSSSIGRYSDFFQQILAKLFKGWSNMKFTSNSQKVPKMKDRGQNSKMLTISEPRWKI